MNNAEASSSDSEFGIVKNSAEYYKSLRSRKAFLEHIPPPEAEDSHPQTTMHETSFYLTGRMAAEEAALLGGDGRKSTPLSFINTTINSETTGRNSRLSPGEEIAHCISSPILEN